MSTGLKTFKNVTMRIGRSLAARELLVHANFPLADDPPAGSTLLLGGVHGDEPATVELLELFKKEHLASGNLLRPTIVWPLVNPDGAEQGTRFNARGVDLNRNCEFLWRPQVEGDEPPGDAPWSEPESRALRDFILRFRPAKIVTLHWALAEFDADGPQSLALLDAIWRALSVGERCPYRRRHSAAPASDALPGSLGGWCGYGLRYPDGTAPAIVTLELPWDPCAPRGDSLPDGHLAACHQRWREDSAGYLSAVKPGVFTALLAACAHK